MPNRRHLLLGCCAALGVGLFTGLGLTARGWRNPCRRPLADTLARHPMVLQAFEGIDPTQLLDTHAHLLGTGDAGSGCRVHPSLHQWWHPLEVLRRHVILDGSCVAPDAPSVDRAYVDRLQVLAGDFPAGARWWLLAFDEACSDDGRERPDWSTFHVPDAWARRTAAAEPTRFQWAASIHPYREDALQRLEAALTPAATGNAPGAAGSAPAVAVKWLPSAMNIDPHDPRCRAFCERLARAGVPLIVHGGEERAAPGAGRAPLNDPLALRALLATGASVIVAHCASLGFAADTDRRSAPRVPAFDLFARLMDERQWQGRLFGDLAAVFQRNRRPAVWHALLARSEWHGRLVHGSDHPLPGVVPLVSLPALVRAEVLAEADVAPLRALRAHNPLLFDFVLKRRLRHQGRGLPAAVFEGRALAAVKAAAGGL